MNLITKILAIAMLALGILIILEAVGVFTISLPFDKLLIGAFIMIALQLLSIILQVVHRSPIRLINILIFIIFIIPAVAYLLSDYLGQFIENILPLVLGVMMLIEALYALH